MATQTGRPIAPARKLLAAVLFTIAAFTTCVGLGMGKWGVVFVSLAVLALAIALFSVNIVRRGARAWVEGTAEVKAVSPAPTSASVYGRAEIVAVIVAPGLATTEVTIREPRVPVVKWPAPGDTLPVSVDVDDSRRVKIQWDQAGPRTELGEDPPPPQATPYDNISDDEDNDLLGGGIGPFPWQDPERRHVRETAPVVTDTPEGQIVEGEFVDHDEAPQTLPKRASASRQNADPDDSPAPSPDLAPDLSADLSADPDASAPDSPAPEAPTYPPPAGPSGPPMSPPGPSGRGPRPFDPSEPPPPPPGARRFADPSEPPPPGPAPRGRDEFPPPPGPSQRLSDPSEPPPPSSARPAPGPAGAASPPPASTADTRGPSRAAWSDDADRPSRATSAEDADGPSRAGGIAAAAAAGAAAGAAASRLGDDRSAADSSDEPPRGSRPGGSPSEEPPRPGPAGADPAAGAASRPGGEFVGARSGGRPEGTRPSPRPRGRSAATAEPSAAYASPAATTTLGPQQSPPAQRTPVVDEFTDLPLDDLATSAPEPVEYDATDIPLGEAVPARRDAPVDLPLDTPQPRESAGIWEPFDFVTDAGQPPAGQPPAEDLDDPDPTPAHWSTPVDDAASTEYRSAAAAGQAPAASPVTGPRRPEPTRVPATPSPVGSFPTAPRPVTPPPTAPPPAIPRPVTPQATGRDEVDFDLDGDPAPAFIPAASTKFVSNAAHDATTIARPTPVPEPAVPEPAVPEPAVPEPAIPESAIPESAIPESFDPEPSAPQRYESLAAENEQPRTDFEPADVPDDATVIPGFEPDDVPDDPPTADIAPEPVAAVRPEPETQETEPVAAVRPEPETVAGTHEAGPERHHGLLAGAAAAVGAAAAAAVAAIKHAGKPERPEPDEPVQDEPAFYRSERPMDEPPPPATAESDAGSAGITPAEAGAAAAAGSELGASSGGAGPTGGAGVSGVPAKIPGPTPAAAQLLAAAKAAGGTGADRGNGPWADLVGNAEPDEHADEVITAYPTARPGPAGAIYGVGITVLVTDLERSIRFYRDTLGFHQIDHKVEHVPGRQDSGSAVLASGDTRLVLRTVGALTSEAGRMIFINLEVGDVEAVYQELEAKGVEFVHSPRLVNRGEHLELWSATFLDPDNHNIAITQWRAIR